MAPDVLLQILQPLQIYLLCVINAFRKHDHISVSLAMDFDVSQLEIGLCHLQQRVIVDFPVADKYRMKCTLCQGQIDF